MNKTTNSILATTNPTDTINCTLTRLLMIDVKSRITSDPMNTYNPPSMGSNPHHPELSFGHAMKNAEMANNTVTIAASNNALSNLNHNGLFRTTFST